MAPDKMESGDGPLDLSQPVTMENLIKLLSASSGIQNEQLVKAFADALRMTAPPRFIQIGEYDPKTSWHPVASEAHTLTRKCFQNGFPLNPDQMSNKEIDLLNAIDRSGRYIDRLVEVILADEGAEEVVYIRYRNKTEDQRNAIRSHIRTLDDMLGQIVAAQQSAEADLLAEGKPKNRRRRPYLDTDQSGIILSP
jgi:hypothetical protein